MQERVQQERLEDRITVLLQDYRVISGVYDKLVSIEMVEGVGHQYLENYVSACSRLLQPDGLCVLQAITIADQNYQNALGSVDFVKKHIFPGTFIPCVATLVSEFAKHSDMVLVNLEDLGADYARTLQEWRTRFLAAQTVIHRMGFDHRFCRMWEFYLAYCEGGFRERTISDVQLVYAKPAYRGQPWRARKV